MYARSARLGWARNGTAPGARLMRLGEQPNEAAPWAGTQRTRVFLGQEARPEFIPPVLNAERTLPSCPTGYRVLDADQDQVGATLVLGVAGGAPYYARCVRQDIFDRPETSKTEPVYPRGYTPVGAEESWSDWLRRTFGLSWTPWVIGGVVVILGGVVVLRVLR